MTHQQIIDSCWQSTVVPLLQTSYPSLSPEQLRRAHAYAYGGSVIQDLGYYPFSNGFFADLAHYVRSGDFVRSLFRHAHTADELAFAIGALSHYLADSIGHGEATNPSVALEFPKLGRKFGPSVNYAQDKIAHSRVEWAFDVGQAVRHRVAPYDYVGYIGFQVPWDQLAAAFSETYGFPIQGVLGRSKNALHSYRFGARRFIPGFTYAQAVVHDHGIPDDLHSSQFDLYERRISQLAQEADWDHYRKKPGIGIHVLAGLIVILPKIGPIKMLAIKGPTEAAESLYIESVNLSTTALMLALNQLGAPEPPPGAVTDLTMAEVIRRENAAAAAPGHLEASAHRTGFALRLSSSLIPNRDLDTGKRVVPGGYPLTDQTYARLLDKLTKDLTKPIPERLRRDILDYYADSDAPISTKRNHEKWAQVQKQLKVLMSMSGENDPGLP